MNILVRDQHPSQGAISVSVQQHELQADQEQCTNGLPWLHGELLVPPGQPLVLLLRIHNRSGIPIIEGQSRLPAGTRCFTFRDLRPLGIDAYAHKKDAEREEIARRIWSRCAYATLTATNIR